MKNLYFLLFLLLSFAANGQLFYALDAPVTIGGQALLNPWAGGLNAPQWSSADLDNDGKPDLYLFDRAGFVHLPFLNIGGPGETKFKFAPQLAGFFPRTFNFAMLRDYDHDGIADFFASSNDEGLPGLKVYKGRFSGGVLVFDKLYFNGNSPFVPVSGDPILDYLFANQFDFPAIDDLDNDGDLDVLGMDPSFFNARYYENMAKEMGYTDDTLIFQLRDDCWGKFSIIPEIEHLVLSGSPDTCSTMFAAPATAEERNGGLHGGGTINTYDIDNDGDKDVFYGDLTYESIIMGMNGGTPENAWIVDQDTTFPSYNSSVDIPDFAASFILDVDNDGLKDFIVSPNRDIASPDYEVGWFYKNTASNEMPSFALQQTDLLVDNMIDFGTGAHPAVADVNGDGLLDIVVGNNSYWQPVIANKDARLFLFLNTGTAAAPAFSLADENWLNFQQFSSSITYDFAPTFGDLDSDGDLDLLVGEVAGKLFFAENTAGAGLPMAFGSVVPEWKGIDAGQHSTPFVHDVNKDGLPDLVIGERNGNINYFPNQGTPTAPAFTPSPEMAPNNNFFGGILTRESTEVTGFSHPAILEFGDTMYLASGSELGWIELYRVNPDSLGGGTFELVSKKLGNHYEGFRTGIAFGQFNDDPFVEAVIGNFRGGLGFYKSPIRTDGAVPAREAVATTSVDIFPNPAGGTLHVRTGHTGGAACRYRIFNPFGQVVAQGQFTGPAADLPVSQLQSGFYFLEISDGRERLVERFVKG
ncbi:MAG: T9SS type A sorting domain-containing protein [Lewinellaceae bacterium]|nr:T9SS type A sorting domain-containing protein [Saprospiraceae bacterium]MCB9339523.1 T9SS type A sorting domain-containing protein [Lewinellaceae bacterium]